MTRIRVTWISARTSRDTCVALTTARSRTDLGDVIRRWRHLVRVLTTDQSVTCIACLLKSKTYYIVCPRTVWGIKRYCDLSVCPSVRPSVCLWVCLSFAKSRDCSSAWTGPGQLQLRYPTAGLSWRVGCGLDGGSTVQMLIDEVEKLKYLLLKVSIMQWAVMNEL